MKKLSIMFWVLAAVSSDVMCAVVAYEYCDISWGIKYAGYSAPLDVAFVMGIPFLIACIISIVLALFFQHKSNSKCAQK